MRWAPKFRGEAAKAVLSAILAFAFFVCALTPQPFPVEPIGSAKPTIAAHHIGLTASLSGGNLKRSLTERSGFVPQFVAGFPPHSNFQLSPAALSHPPADPDLRPRSYLRSTSAGRSPPA